MALESLLGNERLKQNLSAALVKDRFSHFYLISGPAGSGKRTLARLLSQALMCESADKPCGVCNACRKIAADTHPDCITVSDPDKKTVPVEVCSSVPTRASARSTCFPRSCVWKDKTHC